MGKGDKRRPIEIDTDEFNERWDNIFKRKGRNDQVMRHHRKSKYEKENDENSRH